MPRMRRYAVAAVTAILAGPLLAGCASGAESAEGGAPQRFSLATYLAPVGPHGETIQWVVDEVAARSEGSIVIEPYFSGALLGADELLNGAKDGRADFVLFTPQYNPAEMPLSQVVSIPFVNSDTLALGAALDELYANNADYGNEWSAAGVDPLVFIPGTPTVFASHEVVDGIEWINGSSIRAAGYLGAAVQAAGGNAVSLVVGEVYESIQRGLIDGYTSVPFDSLASLSLQEVAPFVADTGLGTFGFNTLAVNAQRWAELPAADRELIESVLEEYSTRYFEVLTEKEDDNCDALAAAGGGVNVWAEADTDAWANALGDAPYRQWLDTASASGADATAFYEQYMQVIDSASADNPTPTGMARCAAR